MLFSMDFNVCASVSVDGFMYMQKYTFYTYSLMNAPSTFAAVHNNLEPQKAYYFFLYSGIKC